MKLNQEIKDSELLSFSDIAVKWGCDEKEALRFLTEYGVVLARIFNVKWKHYEVHDCGHDQILEPAKNLTGRDTIAYCPVQEGNLIEIYCKEKTTINELLHIDYSDSFGDDREGIALGYKPADGNIFELTIDDLCVPTIDVEKIGTEDGSIKLHKACSYHHAHARKIPKSYLKLIGILIRTHYWRDKYYCKGRPNVSSIVSEIERHVAAEEIRGLSNRTLRKIISEAIKEVDKERSERIV